MGRKSLHKQNLFRKLVRKEKKHGFSSQYIVMMSQEHVNNIFSIDIKYIKFKKAN